MIFGKTHKEKEEIEEKRWRDLCENGENKFAWCVRSLTSGEQCWLGWYHISYVEGARWPTSGKLSHPTIITITAGKK